MHKERIKKSERRVKIPSAQRLANIALHYLSRYAASENSLRRVLQNRIRRAAMRDAAFGLDLEKQAQLRIDIETIIEKHRKTGALNDAAYAETKTHSLRRAGRSRRAIALKLAIKGIQRNLIDKALAPNDAEPDTEKTELKAAHILARRRRLGPYRTKTSDDPERSKKDIATLARAGFSLSTARKVLGSTLDDIEEEDFF